jgi:hypothetical protein
MFGSLSVGLGELEAPGQLHRFRYGAVLGRRLRRFAKFRWSGVKEGAEDEAPWLLWACCSVPGDPEGTFPDKSEARYCWIRRPSSPMQRNVAYPLWRKLATPA